MKLLALYFFALPFTSAFNISSVITIPVLSLILFSSYHFAKPFVTSNYLFKVEPYTLLILGSLFCGVISLYYSVFVKYSFVYAHAISLLFVFFAFVLIPARGLAGKSINVLFKPLLYSFIFVCCFCIFEFLTLNFSSVTIVNKIPRPDVTDYSPLFFQILYRARSTFEESGHFASYLTVVFPFLYSYCNPKNKKIITGLFFISLGMSASVGGVIVLMLLIFPFLLFQLERKFKVPLLIVISLAVLIASPIIIEKLMDIYKFKVASGSLTGRFDSYLDSINLFLDGSILNILFGYGPGSYQYMYVEPAINAYLNLLRDVGLLGLLCFFLFINYPIISILMRLSIPNTKYLLSSYGWAVIVTTLAVNFWLLSIPNYFYPHFYLPLIFFIGLKRYVFTEKLE
ncbi:O-antigen ligase family protein [Pseudoalteromonas sp. ASV78]|uniref:O-antigen ligase family protein n=1 Tax=Pseudoalteromonas sp. ASV78 TaxID=3397851 RepID=UPI0039FCC52A